MHQVYLHIFHYKTNLWIVNAPKQRDHLYDYTTKKVDKTECIAFDKGIVQLNKLRPVAFC